MTEVTRNFSLFLFIWILFRTGFYLFGSHFALYQSLNRLPISNSQNCSMFPLAFVAGWLQGHRWGFISRNYVVWPTFLLMNVFTALKGSHFCFWSVDIKTLSPGGCMLPAPGLYTCIKLWKKKKKCIKSNFKEIFLNLQQIRKVISPFCCHQNFVPWGLSASAPGYIHVLNN